MRLILGVVKGAVIGGALGYGAYAAGLGGGFHWVTYGVIGFAVGILVGRPIWSHLLDRSATVWTAVLKGIFGFGIGVGIYALASKVLPSFDLELLGETHAAHEWPFVLGGAIGALYGGFVEVDDAPPAPAEAKDNEKKSKPAS
jgi:hypothetical protein